MAKFKGNKYIIEGNIAKIVINSKKFGYFETLIDTKNVELCKQYTWHVNLAKCNNTFYARTDIRFNKNKITTLYLHKLIKKCSNHLQIDHKNINTLDNREENLRIVSRKQNAENQKTCQKNSKSEIRGVSWSKQNKKWQACIHHNGKTIYGGCYCNLAEAEQVVIKLRQQYFTHSLDCKAVNG